MKILKKLNVSRCLMTLIFLLSVTTTWAQDPENAVLEYPESEENLAMVKQAMQAYETGDWDLLRDQVAPDAVFYHLGSFDSLSIDETIEYWEKGRQKAIPNLADNTVWLPIAAREGPRKGNWVLHWGSNTLRYPNGDSISFPYHIATRIEDDRITEVHFYYDNSKIIRALGYAIDPPLEETEDQGEIPELEEMNNQ